SARSGGCSSARAAAAALFVPDLPHPHAARAERESVISLLRLREFRYVVLIAALVLGSHAMHDAFAMIRWGTGGSARAASNAARRARACRTASPSRSCTSRTCA